MKNVVVIQKHSWHIRITIKINPYKLDSHLAVSSVPDV
jgi:hypothetical protein